jgi:hypothetical protein
MNEPLRDPVKEWGAGTVSLQMEDLLRDAERETGLKDFGDNAFLEPLRILLAAAEGEGRLHRYGRGVLHGMVLHTLRNRLHVQSYWKRHPQALELPIRSPVFIVGMPRTGTTLLFNLLAQDPAHRWLPQWEALTPAPPPSYNPDQRREYAVGANRLIDKVLPGLRAIHSTGPDDPEECGPLLRNSFESEQFWVLFDVPSYLDWLGKRERTRSYRYYRNQLKLLQHQRPGRRWLLKSPAHLLALNALLAVFPDANVIQTHRDPLKALPSFCSLVGTNRGLSTAAGDFQRLGAETAILLSDRLNRCFEVRRGAAGHFHDVQYQALIQDPIGTVEAIYRRFGFDLTEEVLQLMRKFLTDNPRHKHGAHRYSLAQFGLDADTERARFRDYTARFEVPLEQG